MTEALAAEQSELSLEATFFAFLLYPKTCLYPKKKGLLNPFFLFPAKDTFTGILWIWMDPLDMIKLIQDSHTTYVIKAHRGMLGNECSEKLAKFAKAAFHNSGRGHSEHFPPPTAESDGNRRKSFKFLIILCTLLSPLNNQRQLSLITLQAVGARAHYQTDWERLAWSNYSTSDTGKF